ncbi:MAG TPA: helix-turn-helix domain-containing protein [Chitinophagaceae bacterium]|nr:helix-turn-helix domain-containing protein [Chitinophagaceae bacterium]
MKTKYFGIVIYENCTPSMVAGVIDILTLANNLFKASNDNELFKLNTISVSGSPVNGFSHFPIYASQAIKSKTKYDILYIPGFIGDIDDILNENRLLIKWITRQGLKNKTILSAACNGNFLLAETGLLDKKKATTHWSLTNKFRERFEHTELRPEKIIVDEGNIISAAGVTSYFNLALHIIQRFGSTDLALNCAKVFLVDSGRKIQTPYQAYQLPKNHGDAEINKIQNWLESNFKETVNLDRLTKIGNIGKKTLLRRFKKATGETPLIYLQKLRIENAKRLLESKNLSFSEITWEVGYSDVSSFHRAFKAETGLTPVAYRTKFSLI